MKTKNHALNDFIALRPIMLIYSLIAIIFVALSAAGVKLPFDAESFDSTTIGQVLSGIGSVLGLISAFVAKSAIEKQNMGAVKFCAAAGVIAVITYCITMFMAQAHTNPNMWAIFGTIAIIPGLFAGSAIRIATKGWNG